MRASGTSQCRCEHIPAEETRRVMVETALQLQKQAAADCVFIVAVFRIQLHINGWNVLHFSFDVLTLNKESIPAWAFQRSEVRGMTRKPPRLSVGENPARSCEFSECAPFSHHWRIHFRLKIPGVWQIWQTIIFRKRYTADLDQVGMYA